MKGDAGRYLQQDKYHEGHDQTFAKPGLTGVGPTQLWRHEYYPEKTLRLPVGVSAGANWVRVHDAPNGPGEGFWG